MAKIENVSVEDLEAALEDSEGKRETQRLMVAIMYKRGPSVPMIAEWLDMRDGTIYEWLNRFEERSIEDAITDDHRSGRPPKLDEKELEQFESAVNKPPSESGYDQPAWSTKLAQKYLREEFDVEYSMRHITRLLNEAGLSHQTPRPKPPTSDDEEREIFWESVKKTD
jgi:transposase